MSESNITGDEVTSSHWTHVDMNSKKTTNKSYKKNCAYCGAPIWMQYREEFNDYIPLDFGNGGKMKPHDC